MDEAAILARFLDQYRADRAGPGLQSLQTYQAIYPGFEDLIAREFMDLEGSCSDGAGDRSAGWIGPFRIIEELARGGQGEVYLADDPRLNRRVALKVLRGRGAISERVLARFRREAEVTARLEHPSICPVYEAGTADGVAYIAMKYLPGRDLADHVAEARKESSEAGNPSTASRDREAIQRATDIIRQVALALHAAHEAGVVHRDVKPGNIMILPDGAPMILDFGLAADLTEDHESLSRTGETFGTPAYMSPEQLAGGHGDVDRRTDVWSLGVTLYECLTLRRPFDAPTRDSLYQTIRLTEPAKPRALNPAISRDLQVVIETALEKERDRRYLSAHSFAEDLRRIAAGEPILAKPRSAPGRAWRWAKRRPAVAALMIVLLVAVPTVTGLVTAHVKNRPELEIRERQKRRADVERLLEDGFYHFAESQDEGEGARAFEAARRLDPDDHEATAGLALATSFQGDHQGAIALLDRCEDLATSPGLLRVRELVLRRSGRAPERRSHSPEPRTASDFFLLGYVEWLDYVHVGTTEGSPTRALAYADRAVVVSPSARLLYHLQRTEAAIAAKAHAVARESADNLVLLWPENPAAWHSRGHGLCGKNYIDLSIAAFRRSLELRSDPLAMACLAGRLREKGALEEAAATLRRAVDLNPRLHRGWDTLGKVCMDQGRVADAIDAFREACKIEDEAGTWSDLSHALLQVSKFEEAVIASANAVRLDRWWYPAWVLHGHCLRMLGRSAEAVEAYLEAAKLDPEDPASEPTKYELWTERIGWLWLQLGNPEAGAEAFMKGIEIDSKKSSAWRGLVEARILQGKNDAAVEAGVMAVKLEPGDALSQDALGKAYLMQGDYEKAVECHRRATEMWESGLLWENFGIALEYEENLDGAAIAYEKAASLEPNEDGPRRRLGNLYTRLNKAEAAIDQLRTAASLRPANHKNWRDLGRAYRLDSRHYDAVDAFRRALDAHPFDDASWTELCGLLPALDPLTVRGGLEKDLATDAQSAEIPHLLAWFLVQDHALRNVTVALLHARTAVDHGRRQVPRHLETLAMTLENAGHTAEAASVREERVALMRTLESRPARARLKLKYVGSETRSLRENRASRIATPEAPPSSSVPR